MKRTWQSTAERIDRRQFNTGKMTYGPQRFQNSLSMPDVIAHADKQESMRLTLDHMVRLNGGHSVAITIPAVRE